MHLNITKKYTVWSRRDYEERKTVEENLGTIGDHMNPEPVSMQLQMFWWKLMEKESLDV